MVNTDICEGWRWKYKFNKVGGTWPCSREGSTWLSQQLRAALGIPVAGISSPTYCSVLGNLCLLSLKGSQQTPAGKWGDGGSPTLSESSLYLKLPNDKIILGTETLFMLSLLPEYPYDLPCPPALYNQVSISSRSVPRPSCVPDALDHTPADLGYKPTTSHTSTGTRRLQTY